MSIKYAIKFNAYMRHEPATAFYIVRPIFSKKSARRFPLIAAYIATHFVYAGYFVCATYRLN